MIKQNLPFQTCNLAGKLFAPRAAAPDGLAKIDKAKRIPRRLGGEILSRSIELRLGRKLPSAVRQRLKNRMLRHAMKPVFGVPIVGLAAMHDPVPEAALDGVKFLADRMRLIKKIVP